MIKWTILPVTALLLAGCAQHRSDSDTTSMGGTSTTSSQESGTSASRSSSASSSTSSQLSQEDQTFLKEAAQGGMAEVQMGRLASQKGQSEAVKQLGQKLVQDHTKANQELKQLASQKGVTLTSDTASEHKGALDHLRTLQGQEFDKAFTQHALQDHQKDIQKFQKVSQQSQDPEIKAFAAKTLPVLKQHLEMAKSADTQGAGSSSTSDTGTTSGTSSQSQQQTPSQSPSQTPDKQQ